MNVGGGGSQKGTLIHSEVEKEKKKKKRNKISSF